MDTHWIETPHRTWLCTADAYRGIVHEVENKWTARIEDGEIRYPAEILFHSLIEAQTWVEQEIARLARHA